MHPSPRRLLGALALVALGFLLGGLFRPAAPPLPAALVEAGPVRANGSASVTCLTVGDGRHMAVVAHAAGRSSRRCTRSPPACTRPSPFLFP